MPPELAKSHEEESMAPVTEATDVWEFGMTVLEVRIHMRSYFVLCLQIEKEKKC